MKVNNFNFLRLLFATFVIVSHSYALLQQEQQEWLARISGGQLSFMSLRLKCFFIISGYLIFKSLMNSPGVARYLWKRFIRIYPALFVTIILTIVISACYTNLPFSRYFTQKSTWAYLQNISPACLLGSRTIYSIDSVFASNYSNAVNGSIWTIPFEIRMYLLIIPFYFFRKKVVVTRILLFLLFLLYLLPSLPLSVKLPYILLKWNAISADLGIYFIAGALLSSFKIENIPLHFRKAIWLIIIILAFFSLKFNIFQYVRFFILPVFIVLTGLFRPVVIVKIFSKIGDWSYGTFLWGFFIQQQIIYFFHDITPSLLMMTAIPLSWGAGALSWFLLERQMLKLKGMRFNVIKHKLNFLSK